MPHFVFEEMAAPCGDVSRTLKEALFETLSNILSPIHEIRASAEEQLKILEVTDEYGVHLTELTVDPQGPPGIRQLASVLLKQYVEIHWCIHAEKFQPPETVEEAKAAIRHILPLGLRESISKLRTSVAYAISAIAHWDWPEAWPQLFELLMQCLTSGDSNSVHGAMRVLTEFTREITDNQMPQVAPVILPEMYKIFTNERQFGIRTRGRAVEIFSTCAHMIALMNECNKDAIKNLLFPVLTPFTEALVRGLQVPNGNISDSGLKKEILKALTVLVRFVPKQMIAWLPHVLTPVWNTLTESANLYLRTVINNIDESEHAVDSDGEVLGFENLVFSIFEFVCALVETPKFRGMVKKGLSDLLYYVVLYMQMTEEQVQMWSSNPDQFVEDEDEDTFSYSIRISAQDLLMNLCSEFEDESAAGLSSAITKHLQEAEASRSTGSPHWWKIHESCMLALGSVKDLIIEQIQSNHLQFDIVGFLQSVVLVDLNLSVSPFLIGRCIWISSRFVVAMSPDLIQRFIQATVSGLQQNQPPCVRVSSVRAVWGFCEHLKKSRQTSALQPYLAPIMEGLMALATQFSSEVMSLVLETFSIVLSVDRDFTANVESRVAPLAIAVLLKHNSDPVMVSIAEGIFKELCQNPACVGPLQQRLLPVLMSILQAPVEKIPNGLQSVAMDVIQTLVRSSPRPLSEPLVAQVFPVVVQCTLRTDDNSTMQNGGECIRAYVVVALDQISAWHDDSGNSGLHYVVQVAQHLLDPKTSESSACFVGRLISTLISKAGAVLGENTDLLLRAVLSKLQQAEALSIVQSLVMVFAHLIHSQMEAVLEFLSSVPGPTGKSALHFVLVEWCERQHLFYGAYENKVSILAMCKLLEHGVKTNDKRLMDISVRGDQIFSPSSGPKTRSKSSKNPDRWTEIPVLVKIYKLLINELYDAMENAMARTDDDDDSANEGIEEIEQDRPGGATNNIMSQFALASDFPGFDADICDDDDDPDAQADPIYQVELESYLSQFLHTLSQLPCYSSFAQHQTAQEREILVNAGIANQ